MVQGVYNRAALQGALTRTGGNQGFERRVDLSKLLDFAADFLLLRDRLLLDRGAIGVRIGTEREQFIDLGKREPDLLRLFDESNTRDMIGRIDPITLAFQRTLDQAPPLVKADGLDIDARFPRGSGDGECRHDWTFPAPYVGSVVWSGVKGDERAICIRSPDSVGIGHPPVPTVFAAVCTWRQAIR